MKRFIAFILILIFIFCISFQYATAFADPLTLGNLASAAYAYGAAAGINWGFTEGTVAGAKGWMENQINSWLGGQTIEEKFGTETLKCIAGKLIIPATLATKIAQFLSETLFDLGVTIDNPVVASVGSYEGHVINSISQTMIYPPDDIIGTGIEVKAKSNESYYPWSPAIGSSSGGSTANVFLDGVNKGYFSLSGYWRSLIGWYLVLEENNVYAIFELTVGANNQQSGKTDRHTEYSRVLLQSDPTITDRLEISLDSDYEMPEYPDVGYQWEGSIDGSAPDTNLEQLLGLIDTVVPQDLLDVEGEVVDPVIPPTPVPTYPPVDDILPGINTGIEIGNDLIAGQQAQTDAITQGLEGVQEAVGSLEGTIEAIADTPTTEDLPEFKFDLRELFPFCIPFDIYRLLSSFDAEPVAPHVQLPIVIDSINFRYNLDLDFSAWDPVAQAMRTAELIVYAIALAWATGKVIKW